MFHESNRWRACHSRSYTKKRNIHPFPLRETVNQLINRFIYTIDRLIDCIGRAVSWLMVAMVFAVLVVVVTRYFLNIGSIALQESVTYLHAMIFLLGIGFTLQHGGHVRVDIFYRQFAPKRRALVDFCGGILLLIPVSALLLYASWDYVWASWAIRETSPENNGLPFIYLLKTLMLLMPALLFLQGLSEILKSLLTLMGQSDALKGSGLNNTLNSHESLI